MNSQLCESKPNAIVSPYSAKRTRHHMDFFCDAPEAKSVRLVGDFNGWDLAATPMQRMPDGRWMASLELPHGYHQYLFLVDGEAAVDPHATGTVRIEPFGKASVIAVS